MRHGRTAPGRSGAVRALNLAVRVVGRPAAYGA
jgi:hypothetical protein